MEKWLENWNFSFSLWIVLSSWGMICLATLRRASFACLEWMASSRNACPYLQYWRRRMGWLVRFSLHDFCEDLCLTVDTMVLLILLSFSSGGVTFGSNFLLIHCFASDVRNVFFAAVRVEAGETQIVLSNFKCGFGDGGKFMLKGARFTQCSDLPPFKPFLFFWNSWAQIQHFPMLLFLNLKTTMIYARCEIILKNSQCPPLFDSHGCHLFPM